MSDLLADQKHCQIHQRPPDQDADQVNPKHREDKNNPQQDHRAVGANPVIKFHPVIWQEKGDYFFAIQRRQGKQVEKEQSQVDE